MILHFNIDEPKPLHLMTKAELHEYAGHVAALENEIRSYSIAVLSLYIQRVNEENERRGFSAQAPARPTRKAASPKQRTAAEWRALMMQEDDEDEDE